MSNLLDSIVGQQTKLQALRCVFANPGKLTGREIARRIGKSHVSVIKALQELERQGVIVRDATTRAHRFSLQSHYWVVSEILTPMFAKELSFEKDLEAVITKRTPRQVESLVLYGSITRGALTPESDVDLLVLSKSARDKKSIEDHFHAKASEFYRRFNRPLSFLIMSAPEFAKQYKSRNALAREIIKSGRVIHGKLLSEILTRR